MGFWTYSEWWVGELEIWTIHDILIPVQLRLQYNCPRTATYFTENADMYCQYHPRPIIVNNEKSENHTPCDSCSSQSLKENRLKGMINASKSGDSQTNFELPVNNRDSHSHLGCTQSYNLRRWGKQKHFSFGQANNSGGIIHECRGCDYPHELWKMFRFLDLWNCTCWLFRHHTANIGPVVTMSARPVMPPPKEEMFPFLSFRG